MAGAKQQGMMQQGQPAPSQGGMGMADAQRQASQVKPQGVNKGYDMAVNTMKHPGGIPRANEGRMAAEQDAQPMGQGGQQAAMQQAAGKMQGGMMGGQMDQQAMMGGKAQMMQQGGMMGQGGLSPLGQQGGMMGQPSQGNQQQGKMQQQQELTRQMGQAGAVRGSWKDAQGGGAGGAAAMMGGGGTNIGQGQGMMGQGQAGIAQQGGLMGQNAPMNPNQQQEMEAFHKKRQQMQMQGFAQG
jgi:hypothetical protein